MAAPEQTTIMIDDSSRDSAASPVLTVNPAPAPPALIPPPLSESPQPAVAELSARLPTPPEGGVREGGRMLVRVQDKWHPAKVIKVDAQGFDVKFPSSKQQSRSRFSFDEEDTEWQHAAADATETEDEDDEADFQQCNAAKKPRTVGQILGAAARTQNQHTAGATSGSKKKKTGKEAAKRGRGGGKAAQDEGAASDDDFAAAKKKTKKEPGGSQRGMLSFFSKAGGSGATPGAEGARGPASLNPMSRTGASCAAGKEPGGAGFGRADLHLPDGGSVPSYIAENLKGHQVEGISFMWKHVTAKAPNGCILAHSMGLGKSLQVCALVHAFCKRKVKESGKQKAKTEKELVEKTGKKGSARVMLIMPSSLLDNWKNEFKKWVNKSNLPQDAHIKVMCLSAHTAPTADARLRQLKMFAALDEAVLLIGYEMFTNLVKTYANAPEDKRKLLSHTADLVVLDEGHRIKSASSKTAQALAAISTKRRIILTGTPLQNNLQEYWEMVNFVKPGLMWSKKYFRDEWDAPIKQAMLSDAEPHEVRRGKRMMFRLTKRLQPYVQRKDETVLRALLPPKEELVLFVRSSETQLKLYRDLMTHHENICDAARGEGGEACKCKHLLSFHACTQKIVNHPDALRPNWIVKEKEKLKREREQASSTIADSENKTFELARVRMQDTPLAARSGDHNTPRPADKLQTPATSECVRSCAGDVGGVGIQIELLRDLEEANVQHGKGTDKDPDGKQEVVLIDDESSKDSETVNAQCRQGEIEGIDEELVLDDKGGKNNLGMAWADGVFGVQDAYQQGVIEMSGKMSILMEILKEGRLREHKTLVFSQYQTTLDVIQVFIKAHNLAVRQGASAVRGNGDARANAVIRYRRLDGSTPQKDRQDMVNSFNTRSAEHVMLISTKAGGLGLNIPAADRVVLVDAGWNPAHETQAAVRAYRMGQKNPVFVYRLIAVGTMENFVYDRQVNKSQLSKSVVDDTNVTRLFSSRDLEELFRLEHPPPIPEQEVDAYAPKLDVSAKNVIEGKGLQGELLEGGGDKVIASVLRGPRKNWVVKVKRHEDAVEEDNSEELTKEEEELALQEEAEEEERTKRGSLSQLPASSHVVPPPSPLSDLPPGWEMARDANTGREYFFNRRENKSQWERPHVAPLPLAGLAFQQAQQLQQQLQQMLQSQQQGV